MRRTLTAVLTAVAMAGSGASAIAAPPAAKGWHGLGWDLPELQAAKSVPGTVGTMRPERPAGMKPAGAPAAVWPAATSAEVDLAAPAGKVAGRNRQAGRVRVETLDHGVAERAGIRGTLTRISPVSGDTGGPISVGLDYSAFAGAYGGDYGRRLHLVSYPDCLLTTPDVPACRTGTPVESANTGAKEVSGDVVLPRTGSMLLAAEAGGTGGGGDYTATQLSPAGAWTAGGSSGDFSYTYPIALPDAPGGHIPTLKLAYSSSMVDGLTSATNNQASWVGDGWTVNVGGFVERSYKSCAKDLGGNNGQRKTYDQCWATDNATLSLGGSTTDLVKDTATGAWHPRRDDGSKVEKLTGATNGALNGEHWKITTSDGTQYFFGLNRLPGWGAGNPETQSVFTAPVFGNNDNEPCHQQDFANSWCQQAYRWNLDYVVDPHGNAVTYYYQPETNYYGLNMNVTGPGTAYTRAGYLTRVEYGLNTGAGGVYAQAPARVTFDVTERCLPSGSVTCDPGQLTATTAKSWPDVPADQICAQGAKCPTVSPTFFSRKRLTTITTQVPDGSGGWSSANKWALTQSFPNTGDGNSPALWLDSVTHTGLAGGSITLPPTTFTGTAMANRTHANAAYTGLNRNRITSVTGELGGVTTVTYTAPDCQSATPAPESNTTRCYPVRWTPPGADDPVLDWFNKYLVTDVYDDGRTSLSAQKRTHYEYVDGGAWHYDENYLGEAKDRTWSMWRGYGQVVTTSGNPDDPAGPRVATRTYYLRGMNDDKQPTGSRSVSVPNSLGESIVDRKQFNGMTLESQTLLDGNVIATTVNDPWSTDATATDLNGVQSFVTATAVVRVRTRIAALDQWRTNRTTTAFDNSGLPTSVQTEGDTADPKQTTCTRTTYARNTGAWMLSYPSAVQTVSGPCADSNPASSENIVSDSRNRYDGGAFGDPPVTGSVTQIDTVDSWPAGGQETWQIADKKTGYDTYGRTTSTTDANGRTTTTAYTPATGGPVTQVATTGSPVVPGGATMTTLDISDPVSGQVVTKVDAPGMRTEFGRDALGRVTAVWKPGHTRQGPADNTFAYTVSNTAPSVVATGRLLASGQYATDYGIIDGLGRTVQTQAPTSYSKGGRVVTDTLYDSQGRPWKKHNAYWNAAAPAGDLLIVQDNAVPNTTLASYDSAGRTTASIFLKNGTEQWRTTTATDGDRVTTIPPTPGTASTVVTNGLGQKVQTLQYKDRAHTAAGDPADVTSYTYFPSGAQATVTDATGKNTWSFGYDLHGRKVTQTDPDAGTSTTAYDAAGQILSTTDARGRKLVYTYDGIGRKTATYENSTAGTKLAGWLYDTLLKGQLTSATRYAGGKAYVSAIAGYDAGGRPTGTTVVIPPGETGLSGTYTFPITYDPNTGQVATVTSPAKGGLPQETVYRGYDALGALTTSSAATPSGTSTTLVSETDYNPFGQVLRTNYAAATDPKQVSTTNTYEDGTNRFASTLTVRATTTNNVVTNRTYGYDPAGDITKVADTPTADNQCFGYDYLQRLTSAWTPSSGDCAAAPTTAGLGGSAPYWKDWTFDVTGNRKTQTQRTTAGTTTTTSSYPDPGSPRPHALSSTSTTSPGGTTTAEYTYDASGNTLTRGARGSTFDSEGHLATETDPAGKVSTYLYDASGNRLITRDPTGTTLFAGDLELFVPAGSSTASATRSFGHGGQIVARRTTAGLSWLLNDHQGSTLTVIAAATLVATARFSDPYGNTRGTPPSSWPDKHGFIGGYSDTSGLVHLGVRDYDPSLGRFISVDPVLDQKNPQQWNGYGYGNNTPVTQSDPTGAEPHGGPCMQVGNQWIRSDGYSCSQGDDQPWSNCPGCASTATTGTGQATQNNQPGTGRDRTTRHNQAQAVAVEVIRQQAAANHVQGDVITNMRVDNASKKCLYKNEPGADCTYGIPDIVFRDSSTGTYWVWEVKSASQYAKAQSEAQWYVDMIRANGGSAVLGWEIGGPYPVPNKDLVAGPAPGAIVYGKPKDKKYEKATEPMSSKTATETRAAPPEAVPGPEPGTYYQEGVGTRPLCNTDCSAPTEKWVLGGMVVIGGAAVVAGAVAAAPEVGGAVVITTLTQEMFELAG
ncbi:RHS repeat-associated core domain-containing protein [Amycolatopsis sp. NPDC003865]